MFQFLLNRFYLRLERFRLLGAVFLCPIGRGGEGKTASLPEFLDILEVKAVLPTAFLEGIHIDRAAKPELKLCRNSLSLALRKPLKGLFDDFLDHL